VSRYLCLAAAVVFCLPALLPAQMVPVNPRRNTLGRQQSGVQPVEVSGTIRAVARAGIVVGNDNNQMWKVAIVSPTKFSVGTKVQVTGAAQASNLRSGLVVEFSADLDNRGRIQGKVDTLTVTSITREKPMGIFPDDSGFAGNDADKTAKRSGHGKSGRAQIIGRCRIVGRLVVARGGALSVQGGRGTLSFELGEQPRVMIDMADMSLVRPGQEVSVKGIASPRQPNMIQATEVMVKLPEVPQADQPEKADKADKAGKHEKKEPPAKPAAKKGAKAPKKDKDEGLPEPGAEPAADK
jgi:hypothetical protein